MTLEILVKPCIYSVNERVQVITFPTLNTQTKFHPVSYNHITAPAQLLLINNLFLSKFII